MPPTYLGGLHSCIKKYVVFSSHPMTHMGAESLKYTLMMHVIVSK